jgi:hypothetical protein
MCFIRALSLFLFSAGVARKLRIHALAENKLVNIEWKKMM